MRSSLLVASLCVVSLGCATAKQAETGTTTKPGEGAKQEPAKAGGDQGATATKSAADFRRELMAAMEREIEPLSPTVVAAEDDRFKGVAEAAGKISTEEGAQFTTVVIPIGAESDITCFIYKDTIDTGVSMQKMIEALSGSVQIEGLRPTEIVAAGDRPALFFELEYTTAAEGGGRAAGQVKLMASPHDDLPMVCLHDELGYRRTFRRITQGFAASLEPAGKAGAKAPRFAEIQVFKIGELPVGFEHHRIWDGEKGQTISENVSVMVVPRSRNAFSFHDTVSTQVADASGRLTNYSYAKAVDGEVVTQAALEREKGNSYSVEGKDKGAPFHATFESKDKKGLLSDPAIDREVKEKLLTGKKPELTFEGYHPSEAPTALSTITYKKTPAGARSVAVVLGDMTVDGQLDEHGMVEKVELPIGGSSSGAVKMTGDRVMSQGAP